MLLGPKLGQFRGIFQDFRPIQAYSGYVSRAALGARRACAMAA